MTSSDVLAGQVLAAVDPDRVGVGGLGFLVVMLMIVAVVLLVRNMNARLRRLPPRFPGQAPEDSPQDTPRS